MTTFRILERKDSIKQLKFLKSICKTFFNFFLFPLFILFPYLQDTLNMQDHKKAKLFLSVVSSSPVHKKYGCFNVYFLTFSP